MLTIAHVSWPKSRHRTGFRGTLSGVWVAALSLTLIAHVHANPVAPDSAGTLNPPAPPLLTAVLQSPTLQASARRLDAARARAGAAGRLSDVQVEGMVSKMVGPMDERSRMWEVTASQPLPRRGERAADRARAQAVTSMAEADFAVMSGEMAADVAMLLAEAEAAHTRAALLDKQITRLDAVYRAIEARIATGSGRLSDRLTVQSQSASMRLMVEEERRMAGDAEAQLRGLLGLAPDAPLPPFVAPDRESLELTAAPTVQLARARVAEAEAMKQMARASARPMTSVGVRFEQERRAMGAENTVGVAFMSDLPWRSRRYARADLRAAEQDRSAAEAEATASGYRLTAALARVDRAEQLARAARDLNQATLARLRTEYETMTQAAGTTGMSQTSTVLELVELLEKTTNAELQLIRAETALRTAQAELWRFAPATLFLPGQVPTKP